MVDSYYGKYAYSSCAGVIYTSNTFMWLSVVPLLACEGSNPVTRVSVPLSLLILSSCICLFNVITHRNF